MAAAQQQQRLAPALGVLEAGQEGLQVGDRWFVLLLAVQRPSLQQPPAWRLGMPRIAAQQLIIHLAGLWELARVQMAVGGDRLRGDPQLVVRVGLGEPGCVLLSQVVLSDLEGGPGGVVQGRRRLGMLAMLVGDGQVHGHGILALVGQFKSRIGLIQEEIDDKFAVGGLRQHFLDRGQGFGRLLQGQVGPRQPMGRFHGRWAGRFG